jgi:hypothetical protein
MPKNPIVLLARLRNGDAVSGARYCADESLATNDELRDLAVEHARRYHRDLVSKELATFLASPTITDREREGALSLAGFLGFSELESAIAVCWAHTADKARLLPEAIWATTQCCGTDVARALGPLMDFWATLPDDEGAVNVYRKRDVAEDLRFALARGTRAEVVDYLVSRAASDPLMRWPISYICVHIDHPRAIVFFVRYAAKAEAELHGTGKFAPWVSIWSDHWDVSRPNSRKMSAVSMEHLKSLWEESRNDRFLRVRAFHLWSYGVDQDQIDVLAEIHHTSPYYRRALRKRLELGDYSVVPALTPVLLDTSDWEGTYWLRDVFRVWCDEIAVVVRRRLELLEADTPPDFTGGQKDVHHSLSMLLMRIPPRDAETLLSQYWSFLGYSGLFIQAALYIGTPKCLELAALSMNKCPLDVPILKHISRHFGVMTWGWQEHLTSRHLAALVPYLDRLDDSDLWQLAEAAQRIGCPEWGQRHLAARLSEEHRRRFYPSDQDLYNDLDEMFADNDGVWRVRFWLEDFEKRHEVHDRIVALVGDWLAEHRTVKGLEIAAECIQSVGVRKDLGILYKYAIDGPQDKVESITASARFHLCRRSLN